MAATTRTLYLSENSVAYPYLDKTPTESVGVKNPISLPIVDFEKIKETFGDKITSGNLSVIYHANVKEGAPRVYKAISRANFQDGNEIRISKVASVLRVAPTFYSAFIVDDPKNSKCHVIIEMDDSGKSLGKWMDDLAETVTIDEAEKKDSTPRRQQTEEEQTIRKLQEEVRAKIQRQHGAEFATDEVTKTKKISIEETLDKLYPSRETFYCQLFEKMKTLADNRIAYDDPNTGNIMPNIGTEKGLQLIDFDTAELMSDAKTAARKTLASAYTFKHVIEFRALQNPSKRSVQLLTWIAQHR